MTELTYRQKGFLAFFLAPLFVSLVLFGIRFLFYNRKKLLPNSLLHSFFDFVKAGAILSSAFILSSLSSWQYIIVTPIVIILFFYLLFLSLYHIRNIKESKNHIALNDIELLPGVVENHQKDDNRIPLTWEAEDDEEEEGDDSLNQYKSNSNSNSGSNDKTVNFVNRFKRTVFNLTSKSWYIHQLSMTRDDIKRSPKISVFLFILVLVFAIAMPLLLDRVCFCSHPYSFSVRFSRSTSCKHGSICLLYLTLPQDGAHSMILQYHTRDYPSEYSVTIQHPDSGKNTTIERSYLHSMSAIIKEEDRYVSTHYIDGLEPDTIYSFVVCIRSGAICSATKKFRTLPDDGVTPIRFVGGGDIQLNKDARDLAGNAIKQQYSPVHFVIIGGDIAYAEAIPACYKRWDIKLGFLSDYFGNIDGSGLMIPFLFAIGNHEAGGFFQPASSVPFYFPYSAFSKEDASKSPTSRSTYHTHMLNSFGNIAVLDSCIITCWGPQSTWLDKEWSMLPKVTNRLSVYHSPIYPAGFQSLSAKVPSMGQSKMVPIFDKYNVTIVLENHEHLFKRTKPLRDGKVDQDHGTVYIGDGAFGIGSHSKPGNTTDLPWFLDQRSLSNHLWIVTVYPNSTEAFAIDPDGVIIDSVKVVK